MRFATDIVGKSSHLFYEVRLFCDLSVINMLILPYDTKAKFNMVYKIPADKHKKRHNNLPLLSAFHFFSLYYNIICLLFCKKSKEF